jgi:hypothetical protein
MVGRVSQRRNSRLPASLYEIVIFNAGNGSPRMVEIGWVQCSRNRRHGDCGVHSEGDSLDRITQSYAQCIVLHDIEPGARPLEASASTGPTVAGISANSPGQNSAFCKSRGCNARF